MCAYVKFGFKVCVAYIRNVIALYLNPNKIIEWCFGVFWSCVFILLGIQIQHTQNHHRWHETIFQILERFVGELRDPQYNWRNKKKLLIVKIIWCFKKNNMNVKCKSKLNVTPQRRYSWFVMEQKSERMQYRKKKWKVDDITSFAIIQYLYAYSLYWVGNKRYVTWYCWALL